MQFIIAILILMASPSFPRAPRVKPGDIPTSAKWNALANAANAKPRLGTGDFHYRESDYCINWARAIRNADEFGSFPPQGEYWEINALLDTRRPADPPWTPIMGPGDPEGTNVVSPPGAFVFGVEDINYDSEEVRIGFPNFDLWGGNRPPATLEEWWELSKIQGGAIDPDTGAQAVPAIGAARSMLNVGWNFRTPHGKTWGGEFPTPVILNDDCGTTDESGRGIPWLEIKFTALVDGVAIPPNHGSVSTVGGRSVITYAGSCPSWSEFVADGHVQDIRIGGAYYIVFVFSGGSTTFDLLPRSEWIQGPYTGEGHLSRRDAGHFDDMIYDFVVSFRGTEAQRNPDTFDIQKIAFSNKEFSNGQYFLAPNIGHEFAGEIVPEYPTATVSTDKKPIASGTKLKFIGGASQHEYRSGYVMGACFAKATGLAAPVTLEVLDGDKVLTTLQLSPEQPQALKTFPDAKTPNPLSVRLANKAKFIDGPGKIVFEAKELYPYKPKDNEGHYDAYLMLRSSATLGGDEFTGTFLDGSGFDYTTSPEIYENYKRYGAIVNTNTAGVRTQNIAINPNPVYEAMRRRLMTLFRMFRRQDFISYEIDSAGRPVLRFKRFPYGLSKSVKADNWAGIAPDWRGVSEVVEGVEYVVRSHTGGKITYNGMKYAHEKRFIGGTTKTFDTDGDALLLEYEGIHAEAPRNGYSNEWLFSEEFHPEHPSESSIFKESAFADYFVRGNRCGFYSTGLHSDSFQPELSRLADIGPDYDTSLRQLHLSPEIPSGFNYYGGLNSSADADFCASCQIYKAPYEFASVTVEFDAAGDDVIKAVFKAPFHRHPSAPTSFDSNPLNWTDLQIAALRAESYRTTDNGLREYMLYKAKGIHSSYKTGDSAFVSGVTTIPDNPLGYVFPRFFATSLVKKVYSDGNDQWDAHDTRMAVDEMIKLRIKLKTWCEGAVDGFATTNHVCDDSGTAPYDFTFENLCFAAFQGADIERPMVNDDLKAATFNQLAECLDQLYMFNLRRVCTFQATDIAYYSEGVIDPTWGTGVCPPNAGAAAYWSGAPPAPPLVSTSVSSTLTASCIAGLSLCGDGGITSRPGMIVDKHDIAFSYIITPGFENAIPDYLKDLIDAGNIAAVGTLQSTVAVPKKFDAIDVAQTACTEDGDGPATFLPINAYFKAETKVSDPVCAIVKAQTLTAGNPQGGDYSICSYADAGSGTGYSFNGAAFSASLSFVKLNDDNSAIIVVPLVDQEVES